MQDAQNEDVVRAYLVIDRMGPMDEGARQFINLRALTADLGVFANPLERLLQTAVIGNRLRSTKLR